ncbi:MAG: energy transducer TonB [candidate division NC10 bacterium]|nr:energy transducer TonB [candidate division NC10 bacterium]
MKRLEFMGGWRSTWQRPGWAASSCLLHLLLVGVLILLQPASNSPKAGLRVRLIEEPQAPPSVEASQPVRTPAAPPKSPSVARRTARRLASGRVPLPAFESDEVAIARVAPATLPTPPAAPVDVAPPAPPRTAHEAEGEGRAPRVVEESGGHAGGGRGAAGGSGGPPASGAPERFSGAFLVSSAGSGTGLAGTGNGAAADSGGKGIGPGRGGAGEGNGTGVARGGVASLGGAPGRGGTGASVADLWRVIRRKIEHEHAKAYPETAHLEGIEGTVEVRFRIAGNGSVETVEVVRSSGFPVLDELSVQTIHRAGPYPVVADEIQISLSYRLDR